MDPATPATTETPAPTPVSAQSVIDSLSHDERGTWQETGELPARIAIGAQSKPSDVPAASSPAPETPADSSPAQPVEQAAGTPASPDATASAAVKPAKERQRGNAETRIQELLDADRRHREQIARLTGQIEALSRGPAKPDASSVSSPDKPPTQAEWERFARMPDAPQEADFERFADYTAAMSLFVTDKRWAEHTARSQRDTAIRSREAAIVQVGETATQRIQEYAKAHPEFDSKVNPQLLEIPTASFLRLQGKDPRTGKDPVIGPHNVLADEILTSEHVGPLLEHFSTEEGRQDWGRLCGMPSEGALKRAFGRLEARFDGAAASTPAPKTVSSAPTPPVTLGTRTADTADPLERAIKSKDTAAYIREANKRDLAALGL